MDQIRALPGARPLPDDGWAWLVPVDAWAVLREKLRHEVVSYSERRVDLDSVPHADRLRPYQRRDLDFLIRHGHAVLAYEQRVGKTPVACVGAAALLRAKQVEKVVVVYPAGVGGVWKKHVREWADDELFMLEGLTNFSDMESLDEEASRNFARLRDARWVGCHYEIFGARELDLHVVLQSRHFVIIGDEGHAIANWKTRRTQAAKRLSCAWGPVVFPNDLVDESPLLKRAAAQAAQQGLDTSEGVAVLSGHCTGVWTLTGTPMRNRPMDLRMLLEFTNPGSTGSAEKFGKRYAGAVLADHGTHVEYEGDVPHIRPGHWDYSGSSNEEELSKRLSTIMVRRFRRDPEVAPYLPKTERVVIMAEFARKADQKKYETAERALATKVGDLGEVDPTREQREAIKTLVGKIFPSKLPKIVERVKFHAGRGVKFIVSAFHHESLEAIVASLGAEGLLPQVFVAGGWLTKEKREQALEAWRAAPAPAILAANKMSLMLGIDLSDADCCVDTELVWVPFDQRQWEDRLADVHLGKRSSPPLIEYVLQKGTIDAAIAQVMVHKLRLADRVVPGKDTEARGLETALLDGTGGVVDPSRLHLSSTDTETVRAVLRSVRDRWLRGEGGKAEDGAAALAAEVAADWDSEDDLVEGGDAT